LQQNSLLIGAGNFFQLAGKLQGNRKRPFLAHLFWVSRTRSVLALDLQMRRDGDGEEGFRELAQSHRLSHTLSHSPSHVTNEPAAATDRPIGARGPSAGIQ
jgi:hypothetical protein